MISVQEERRSDRCVGGGDHLHSGRDTRNQEENP